MVHFKKDLKEKKDPLYRQIFPGGSDDKNLPAMRETQVQFLGQEVPLGKEMATHSSILAWRVPWTEAPGGLQSMVLQKQDMTWCYLWHNNQCDSTCCILLALQIV